MESFFQLNNRGLLVESHRKPDEFERRVVGTAIAAANAAYGGISDFGEVSLEREVEIGDFVEYTNPGSDVLQHGVVQAFHGGDQQVQVAHAKGKFHLVDTDCVRLQRESTTDAIVQGFNATPFDAAVSKVMWSRSDDGQHTHLVAKAQLLADAPETLVVACRGTVNESDWKDNFSPSLQNRGDNVWESHAHGGFLSRCDTIAVEPFVHCLLNGGSVLFTGHSLGSAVAELLALKVVMHLKQLNPPQSFEPINKGNLIFIGFASPVVGVEGLGKIIRNTLGPLSGIFHHFQTKNDAVPLLTHLKALKESEWAGSSQKAFHEGTRKGTKALLGAAAQVFLPGYAKFIATFAAEAIAPHAVNWLGKKVKSTLPQFSKCYGRWYLEKERTNTWFTYDLTYESPKHYEDVTYNLMRRDVEEVQSLDSDALMKRLSDHKMRRYNSIFLDRYGTGPRFLECRAAYVYDYHVGDGTIKFPTAAKHSSEMKQLRVSLQADGSFPTSTLVSLAGCTSTATSGDDSGHPIRALGGVTSAVRHFPYAVDITFPYDKAAGSIAEETAVRLESRYVWGDNTATQHVAIKVVPIEVNSDDAHVIDILRRSLFVSLSGKMKDANGDGDTISRMVQCELKKLEVVAAQRSLLEEGHPATPDVDLDAALLMPGDCGVLLDVKIGGQSFIDMNNIAKYCLDPAPVPKGKSGRISFQRHGETDAYWMMHGPVKDNLYIKEKRDGLATTNDPNEAVVVRFFRNKQSQLYCYNVRTQTFLTRLTGMLFSAWPQFTFDAHERGHRMLPSHVVELFKNGAPVNPTNVRSDPLVWCSRLLVHRYTRDGYRHDQQVQQKIIQDPQSFIDTLDIHNPDEYNSYKVALEDWSHQDAKAKKMLRYESPDGKPVSLGSLVEKEGCGFPPFIQVHDIFTQWGRVPAGPTAPMTRFYFAALPSLIQIALTACHVGSKSLEQEKRDGVVSALWDKLFRVPKETTIESDYFRRVLYVARHLSGTHFDDVRASFEKYKGKEERAELGVKREYTLTQLHKLMLRFDESHRSDWKLLHGGGFDVEKLKELLIDKKIHPKVVKSIFFIYRIIVRIATLDAILEKINVIAVYGPQQIGKSTLLEHLTGRSAKTSQDAHGHTKEPFIIAASGEQPHMETCHTCAFDHPVSHTKMNPGNYICDLPGITDGSSVGLELQCLQVLSLGVAKGVIVLQPMVSSLHNIQNFRAVENVQPSTPVVVLLVLANKRFSEIKHQYDTKGVPTRLTPHSNDSSRLVMDWEGKTYQLDATALPFIDGRTVQLVVSPDAAGDGRLMTSHSQSFPVHVAVGHTPPTGKDTPVVGSGLCHVVEAPETHGMEDAPTEDVEQVLEAVAERCEGAPWPDEFIRQVNQELATTVSARTANEVEKVLLKMVLETTDAFECVKAVCASLPGGKGPQQEEQRPITYHRAATIWAEVDKEAKLLKKEITDRLYQRISLPPGAFQFYIPRGKVGTSLFSDFNAKPHPKLNVSLLDKIELRRNRSVAKGSLLEPVPDARPPAKRVPVLSAEDRGHSESIRELGEKIDKMFEDASLDVILDQEDVRAFLASHAGFGRKLNSKVLRCIGVLSSFADKSISDPLLASTLRDGDSPALMQVPCRELVTKDPALRQALRTVNFDTLVPRAHATVSTRCSDIEPALRIPYDEAFALALFTANLDGKKFSSVLNAKLAEDPAPVLPLTKYVTSAVHMLSSRVKTRVYLGIQMGALPKEHHRGARIKWTGFTACAASAAPALKHAVDGVLMVVDAYNGACIDAYAEGKPTYEYVLPPCDLIVVSEGLEKPEPGTNTAETGCHVIRLEEATERPPDPVPTKRERTPSVASSSGSE